MYIFSNMVLGKQHFRSKTIPILIFLIFQTFLVNVNIVDEEQSKVIQSYDPCAPVTRKGVLRSLRNCRSMEIRDEDSVRKHMNTI